MRQSRRLPGKKSQVDFHSSKLNKIFFNTILTRPLHFKVYMKGVRCLRRISLTNMAPKMEKIVQLIGIKKESSIGIL
jgi:hypothetical protein